MEGGWGGAAGLSCREDPFLFSLNPNVSVLPDFNQFLFCMAAVFYSLGSTPISVSIDLRVFSDAFEVRSRLNTNDFCCISCALCVSKGAVSSGPVLSKIAQQFKNPKLLKQI